MSAQTQTLSRARTIIVLICAASLTGCIPVLEKYPRIEAPGATHFKSICKGTVGPPTTAYYPFHGIFISLNLTYLELGLHLPAGTTAHLNGASIHVVGLTREGPFDRVIHLKELPKGDTRNSGVEEIAHMNWSPYMGIDEQNPNHALLPRHLVRGTIELPSITVNGQTYGPHIVHFERKTWAELMPVNC